MPVWTNQSNGSKDYANFAADIGKAATTGSFQGDYSESCSKNGLVVCPFIKIEELGPSMHSCKLLNCDIDIATWRSMLVACSATGSTVTELCFSNIQVSPQHIADLAIFVKAKAIECLKLDYLTVLGDAEAMYVSLKSVIANATSLQYLSLKGNNLDDRFLHETVTELRNHPCLVCLNLTENSITDEGMTTLFQMLPLAIGLNCISVKNNYITGASIVPGLEGLICGIVVTPEIETELKAIGKIVGDRNKAIRDLNKKRKKEELPELPELTPPGNRVVKGESTLLFNRTIHTIDVSRNSGFDVNDMNVLADVSGKLMSSPPLDEATQCALTLTLHGLSDGDKSFVSNTDFNGLLRFVC